MTPARPIALGLLALLLAGSARCAGEDWMKLVAADAMRPAAAVPAAPTASVVWDGPVDAETYRLGPGDRLAALVYNLQRDRLDFEVGSDGRVTIAGLGRYEASGSLADFTRRLEPELAGFWGGDSASVWLLQPRPIRVRVSGHRLPSATLEMRYLDRLSDAYDRAQFEVETPPPAPAGPPLPDILLSHESDAPVSLRQVRVIRSNDTLDVDLLAGLRLGDPAGDPVLESGDVLLFGRRAPSLLVSGPFVLDADSIEFRPGDTPARIVELLGGCREPGAWSLELARSGDGGLELATLRPGESAFANRTLAPGDRLYLRSDRPAPRVSEVLVEGEVLRPGRYPLEAGRSTLADLLVRAQPDPLRADTLAVIVHRAPGADSELEYFGEAMRTLALERIERDYLKSRIVLGRDRVAITVDRQWIDPAKFVLQDGDRVEVPRKTDEVELLGAVQRPGRQPWREGWTVADYLREAGGKLKGSYLSRAKVRTGAGGHFVPLKTRMELRPGDVVMVPYREELTAWEKFKEGLTVISQLMTVVLVARSI